MAIIASLRSNPGFNHGASRTIESLSLLRERWHAKRDGEGLGRVQAKMACFEFSKQPQKRPLRRRDGEGLKRIVVVTIKGSD